MSKKRKRTSRKSNRKRRRSRKRVANINLFRGASLMPDRARTKLTYTQYIALSDAQLAAGYYRFRGNSIYDPDLTGVGHQPRFHDQLNTYYDRYSVLKSKVTVEVLPIRPGANFLEANTGLYVGLMASPDDQSTGVNFVGNVADMKERGVKHVFMPCTSQHAGGSGPAQSHGSLAETGGTRKLTLSRTRKIMTDTGKTQDNQVVADFGANPTEQWYYDVVWAPSHNTTGGLAGANGDVSFLVTIDYWVDLFASKQVGQS